MGKKQKIWTVSGVNRALRELIEDGFFPLWLTGEVSNVVIHRSGHVYMTVKDQKSEIRAVYFGGADAARDMDLTNGMEVEIYGSLTVYEPRGQYQVKVSLMRPKGIGSLAQRFEELKRKLLEEGLFDEDRKKPIPELPKCVGIISSPDGAALQDFLQIINRRFGDVHIRIYPAAVQGKYAAGEVASGIKFMNETQACDVLVVTRGGGSLEDLWPFNEEIVARAVAESAIPIISAVGHEVDFTICDFVADMRVPTPSAAAELVIGHKAGFEQTIKSLSRRLASCLQLKIARMKQRLERVKSSYIFRDPTRIIQDYAQKCDDLNMRMANALTRYLEVKKMHLKNYQVQLKALNPNNVLRRGYSLVQTKEGKVIVSPEDVKSGDTLEVTLQKGKMEVIKK